ncbi:sigma-70 family RNA polymerase sigma factor [Romboutsia weinsteinii]|nr:sigma-70 family RNA polymerase sigma factor [Romboutsia weinsteinii]
MNDLELINRLKDRDESALIDLIDIYGDLIYRASNKVLNNKELSEECLNIVLLKVWDGIDYYNDDKGLFKNWIFTLSKYSAIDILRKENKHISNKLELKEYIKDRNKVEDIVLVKEEIRELNNNLRNLNQTEKEIFIERYQKGRKIKDIAKSFGINQRALSLRIMRIKKKLKKS